MKLVIVFHLPTNSPDANYTAGTRYILVGFDSIDAKDPLTGEDTNLSLFSSWLNFSWMAVRFKEGHLDGRRTRNLGNERDDEHAEDFKYSRYAVSLFRDLYNAMVSKTINCLLDCAYVIPVQSYKSAHHLHCYRPFLQTLLLRSEVSKQLQQKTLNHISKCWMKQCKSKR